MIKTITNWLLWVGEFLTYSFGTSPHVHAIRMFYINHTEISTTIVNLFLSYLMGKHQGNLDTLYQGLLGIINTHEMQNILNNPKNEYLKEVMYTLTSTIGLMLNKNEIQWKSNKSVIQNVFHEHENGENYKLFFDAIENLSNDTDVENALHILKTISRYSIRNLPRDTVEEEFIYDFLKTNRRVVSTLHDTESAKLFIDYLKPLTAMDEIYSTVKIAFRDNEVPPTGVQQVLDILLKSKKTHASWFNQLQLLIKDLISHEESQTFNFFRLTQGIAQNISLNDATLQKIIQVIAECAEYQNPVTNQDLKEANLDEFHLNNLKFYSWETRQDIIKKLKANGASATRLSLEFNQNELLSAGYSYADLQRNYSEVHLFTQISRLAYHMSDSMQDTELRHVLKMISEDFYIGLQGIDENIESNDYIQDYLIKSIVVGIVVYFGLFLTACILAGTGAYALPFILFSSFLLTAFIIIGMNYFFSNVHDEKISQELKLLNDEQDQAVQLILEEDYEKYSKFLIGPIIKEVSNVLVFIEEISLKIFKALLVGALAGIVCVSLIGILTYASVPIALAAMSSIAVTCVLFSVIALTTYFLESKNTTSLENRSPIENDDLSVNQHIEYEINSLEVTTNISVILISAAIGIGIIGLISYFGLPIIAALSTGILATALTYTTFKIIHQKFKKECENTIQFNVEDEILPLSKDNNERNASSSNAIVLEEHTPPSDDPIIFDVARDLEVFVGRDIANMQTGNLILYLPLISDFLFALGTNVDYEDFLDHFDSSASSSTRVKTVFIEAIMKTLPFLNSFDSSENNVHVLKDAWLEVVEEFQERQYDDIANTEDFKKLQSLSQSIHNIFAKSPPNLRTVLSEAILEAAHYYEKHIFDSQIMIQCVAKIKQCFNLEFDHEATGTFLMNPEHDNPVEFLDSFILQLEIWAKKDRERYKGLLYTIANIKEQKVIDDKHWLAFITQTTSFFRDNIRDDLEHRHIVEAHLTQIITMLEMLRLTEKRSVDFHNTYQKDIIEKFKKLIPIIQLLIFIVFSTILITAPVAQPLLIGLVVVSGLYFLLLSTLSNILTPAVSNNTSSTEKQLNHVSEFLNNQDQHPRSYMISRYVNSRILCVEAFKGEIKKHYRLFKIVFAASVAISIIAILALSSFNSGLIFLPLIIVLVAVVSDVVLQKDWRKSYSNVDPITILSNTHTQSETIAPQRQPHISITRLQDTRGQEDTYSQDDGAPFFHLPSTISRDR